METNDLGRRAKARLELLAKEADSRLEKYWEEEIASNFGFNQSQKELIRKMLLHAKEHNLRKAKRIRASFIYYSFLLGGIKSDERVWRAAEAVELVHTALLMHDDFMDRDLVRRGLPTTQVFFANGDEHYGDSMAVNVGDAVLCLGFERLLTSGFDSEKVNNAMKQFLRGITNTAYGQAYDTSLPKLGDMSEEKVMSLHRAKTAIYTYENPLLIGGILSGLNRETMDVLHDYSVDAGIAFQLQDDVLGVYGDEEKTGKSANSDLLQGKVTLLVSKTMEIGSKEQKIDLMRVWGKLDANKNEIEVAKKAIKESGSYKYSVEVARNYAKRASGSVAKLHGIGLNEEAVNYLEGIALYMVEREV